MNLDPYLLQGFETLKNTTITISGFAPIDCMFDNSAQAHEKSMTFQEDFESPIVVRSSDLPASKKSVIGKTAFVQLTEETYRIDRIRIGSATTFLYLNSKDKV